jgi:hypothetical protein
LGEKGRIPIILEQFSDLLVSEVGFETLEVGLSGVDSNHEADFREPKFLHLEDFLYVLDD